MVVSRKKFCVLFLVFALSGAQAFCQLEPADNDADYFIEEEERNKSNETEVSPEDVVFKVKISDDRYIYLIRKSWYLDIYQTLNEPEIGDTTLVSDTNSLHDKSPEFLSNMDSVVCKSRVYAGNVICVSNREIKIKHESKFTYLNLDVDSVICVKYKSGYTDSLELLSAVRIDSLHSRVDFFESTTNSTYKNSFIVNPASLILMRQMQLVYSRYFLNNDLKLSIPGYYSFRTYNLGVINYYKLWGLGMDLGYRMAESLYLGVGYERGELLSYDFDSYTLVFPTELAGVESTGFSSYSGFLELNFPYKSGFTVGGLFGGGIQAIEKSFVSRPVLRIQLNLGWSF